MRRILRSMHKAGVLHRDIRSWNLLEDDFGRVYIADFDRAIRLASQKYYTVELERLKRFIDGGYVDDEPVIDGDDLTLEAPS